MSRAGLGPFRGSWPQPVKTVSNANLSRLTVEFYTPFADNATEYFIGWAMFREIHPEDLIIKQNDGTGQVNHSMVREFGLFNLSQDLQEELLGIYLTNASHRGDFEKFQVQTYIMLCKNINLFPFPVITNFTSGNAYQFNMDMLEKFAK